MADGGADRRFDHMKDFVFASCYAGLAFGNAGCAAVHALSYSIGGAFHVPHGEANYQFFAEVLKLYAKREPDGKILELTELFADVLGIPVDAGVYDALDTFLGGLIEKKRLRDYGMTEEQIDTFTQSTIDEQQRLLVNNYVPLSKDELRGIFAALY